MEAVAACERIQRHDYEDTLAGSLEKMHRLVPTLYDQTLPTDQEQLEKRYTSYHKTQMYVWRKYGIEIKGSQRKKRYFLPDLESFRGGMESDFTVAVYDELDQQLAMIPVRTYTLPFIMRRTRYSERSKVQFVALLQQKHPLQADVWWQELERQPNLLGYIYVHSLIAGKANDVYFEISKAEIGALFHQVIRLQGLTIGGDNTQLLTTAQGLNSKLSKQAMNCWVSEHNGFKFSETKHLPPLFAIYPLHALLPNGKFHQWIIAFGLDAFFLECITQRTRRTTIRTDDTAIIL